MKSIYSAPTIQRIIDHWQIGQLTDLTYFQNVGHGIWRHWLETNRGTFELYSFSPESRPSSLIKLTDFLADRGEILDPESIDDYLVHSFDRHQLLVQLSKIHQISSKQACQDLNSLLSQPVEKAFRVYGSIIQLHLGNEDLDYAHTLVSYGNWIINKTVNHESSTLADTRIHYRDQLDAAIERLVDGKPLIISYDLEDQGLTFCLSNQVTIQFIETNHFAAAELHLCHRRINLYLSNTTSSYYQRENREVKKVPIYQKN